MLSYLKIQNFTIIDTLEIEFSQGMTVITGETGAGKSIMFDALDLALGKKVQTACIRPGCEQCTITAAFDIRELPSAIQWFETQGIENVDCECIIKRVISDKGRSRVSINDTVLTLHTLRDLAQTLITILGQHDAHHLLNTDGHITRLDKYAKHDDLLHAVEKNFHAWHAKETELKKLQHLQAEAAKTQSLLQYQLNEWQDAAFTTEELIDLEQRLKIQSQSSDLMHSCQHWLERLQTAESGSIVSELHSILKDALAAEKVDPTLHNIVNTLETSIVQLEEAVTDIKHYSDNIENDPQSLQAITDKISTIHTLARKYKLSEQALPEHFSQLATQLNEIENLSDNITEITKEVDAHKATYLAQAKKLTTARTKATKQLSQVVTQQIQPLGMPKGIFQVALTPLDENHAKANGMDCVEFLVQTNPGQPLQPLAQVVSGGELSRINLAIHVNITPATARPTMLFDEVDVGISGKTAYLVGELLRELASTGQIICITHLPQIAAVAHQHWCVEKHVSNNKTHIEIHALDTQRRIDAIASMLGGHSITEQSRQHAKELLAEAV